MITRRAPHLSLLLLLAAISWSRSSSAWVAKTFLASRRLGRSLVSSRGGGEDETGRITDRDRVRRSLLCRSDAPHEQALMREALELALMGEGKTHPNPMVGCIVASSDGSRVLGRGYHPAAGEPHAEIFALRDAGADVQRGGPGGRWRVTREPSLANATVYVTLEPCSHFGRTPPCCDALVDAGVGRVVIGIEDPAPWVAGAGIERLRQSGLTVDVGAEAEACAAANAAWIANITALPRAT